MGTAGQFTPEKLVMGILCSRPAREKELLDGLVERWGRIDYRSETFPFTFTHYYDEEMDGPIGRLFVSFERLVDPSTLAAIKRETNAIEHTFREDGGRRVNIDPGLMALSRFTLATTKENAHRIPLSDGIGDHPSVRTRGLSTARMDLSRLSFGALQGASLRHPRAVQGAAPRPPFVRVRGACRVARPTFS